MGFGGTGFSGGNDFGGIGGGGNSRIIGEFFFASSLSDETGLLAVNPGTIANGAIDNPIWAQRWPQFVQGNDIVFPADVEGMFLRNVGGNAASEGVFQDSENKDHTHTTVDRYAPGFTGRGNGGNVARSGRTDLTRTTSTSGDVEARPANRSMQLWTVLDSFVGSPASLVSPEPASFSVNTATPHGLSVLDPIFWDGSNWVRATVAPGAIATAANAIVVEVVSPTEFAFVRDGFHTVTGHGLNLYEYYYTPASVGGPIPHSQRDESAYQRLFLPVGPNTLMVNVFPAIGGTTPTSAADALQFLQSKTFQTPDDPIIFRQDISDGPASANFFADLTEVGAFNADSLDPASETKFSLLGDIERFRQANGNFRFRLDYLDIGEFIEWEQTSSPLDLPENEVTGFSLISSSSPVPLFGGLSVDTVYGRAFIDGEQNTNTWWFAVAVFQWWNSAGGLGTAAFPNPNRSSGLIRLTVRDETPSRHVVNYYLDPDGTTIRTFAFEEGDLTTFAEISAVHAEWMEV